MDLIQLLVYLVVLIGIGCAAYWVITKFFQPPIQGFALAIVGLILLAALVYLFFPGIAHMKVWK